MKYKILIVGGTGMLGRPVALKLKEAGFDVKVFTRNISEARIKMPTAFEFAEGDIHNPASLESAMKDCQGVHINLQGGPTIKSIEETEYQGVVNVIEAAKKSQIKKITIISGASTNQENAWYRPTKAKLMAEEWLKNSGINYVIFRPSWFFESLPLFVKNNKAMLIGKNTNQYHWVAASDYADLVVKSYQTDSANNKTLFVYGPEGLTMEEALARYCKIKLPGTKISKIPSGMLKFIGVISFNNELKFIAGFMDYFSKVGENDDARETELLLKKPETRLEEWASTQ